MKSFAFLAAGIFALMLLTVSIGGGQDPKKAEGVTEVPLNSIHFTDEQKGLKYLRIGRGDEGFALELRQVFEGIQKNGASNLFLTRGNDIGEAVRSTGEVFRAYANVDTIVSHPQSKGEDAWLVVFFGFQEGHGTWVIKGGHVKGRQIRLTYVKPQRSTITANVSVVLAWVPLGKLEPGTYALELFDEQERQVTLMRRVVVPKK